jgi:hypothetical protein
VSDQLVTAGMVLLEERVEARDVLWCVTFVGKPKANGTVTAKLLSFSGTNTGKESDVWATATATATFPDGIVKPPFVLVTVDEVDIHIGLR